MGPTLPLRSDYQRVNRNALAGHVEPAHFNDFEFESQRRTFTTYGNMIKRGLKELFLVIY